MKKPSDIFEGSDSSLKKAFDEATTPTHDTQLREEFDREWKDGYIENVKTYRKSQPVADWWLAKIHSARKEAQMEMIEKIGNQMRHISFDTTRDVTIVLDILDSDRSNIK